MFQGERGEVEGRCGGWGRLFMQRVEDAWNTLPEKMVEAGTLGTFKRHLERYTNRE